MFHMCRSKTRKSRMRLTWSCPCMLSTVRSMVGDTSSLYSLHAIVTIFHWFFACTPWVLPSAYGQPIRQPRFGRLKISSVTCGCSTSMRCFHASRVAQNRMLLLPLPTRRYRSGEQPRGGAKDVVSLSRAELLALHY